MRRTLATLVLLCSLAPVAPAAAAPARELVLVGDRSASVDVTFASRFKPEVGVTGWQGVDAVTKGTYAGVVFENLAKPMLAQGGVSVPAMKDGDLPIGWGSSDREDFSLPAGRYRVHLVADGPSTVRVRVGGLARSMRLVPGRPSDVRGKVVAVDAVRATIPVVVKPSTTTVMVGFTHSEPSVGSAMNVCLDEGTGTPCEAGNAYGMTATFLAPGLWSSTMASVVVYPGFASSGEHEASYTISAASVTPKVYAFALTVH